MYHINVNCIIIMCVKVLFVADKPGGGGGTPGNGSGRTGSSSEGATDSEKEADLKRSSSRKDKAQSNGQIVKVLFKPKVANLIDIT